MNASALSAIALASAVAAPTDHRSLMFRWASPPSGRCRLRPRGTTKPIESKGEARARKKAERQRRKAARR